MINADVSRFALPGRAERVRYCAIAVLVCVACGLSGCVGGGAVSGPTGTSSSGSSNVPHY